MVGLRYLIKKINKRSNGGEMDGAWSKGMVAGGVQGQAWVLRGGRGSAKREPKPITR